MSGPLERPDAEALDLSDRVALVEGRLDLVDERLASPRPVTPAEARAAAVRAHQRDLVVALAVAFVVVVVALTYVINAALEAGKDVLS